MISTTLCVLRQHSGVAEMRGKRGKIDFCEASELFAPSRRRDVFCYQQIALAVLTRSSCFHAEMMRKLSVSRAREQKLIKIRQQFESRGGAWLSGVDFSASFGVFSEEIRAGLERNVGLKLKLPSHQMFCCLHHKTSQMWTENLFTGKPNP